MSRKQSDLQMLAAVFVLLLALACSATGSGHGGTTASAEEASRPADAESVGLMVPSGSVLVIEFRESLSSADSKAGDSFRATLAEPVYVGDRIAIGAGATISGKVIDAWSASRGRAQLNVAFTGLEPASGAHLPIEARFHVEGEAGGVAPVGAEVVGRRSPEAAQAAGAAATETVIGAIAGSESGSAVVAATDGQEVRIPTGTTLEIRLDEPVVLSAAA